MTATIKLPSPRLLKPGSFQYVGKSYQSLAFSRGLTVLGVMDLWLRVSTIIECNLYRVLYRVLGLNVAWLKDFMRLSF